MKLWASYNALAKVMRSSKPNDWLSFHWAPSRYSFGVRYSSVLVRPTFVVAQPEQLDQRPRVLPVVERLQVQTLVPQRPVRLDAAGNAAASDDAGQ